MYYETWEQLKTRPLFPMARAGGPATSRIAADRIALSGVVGNHYRRILEALQIGPAGGLGDWPAGRYGSCTGQTPGVQDAGPRACRTHGAEGAE